MIVRRAFLCCSTVAVCVVSSCAPSLGDSPVASSEAPRVESDRATPDAEPAPPQRELEGLVQAVISLGCLVPYWHADTIPARSPLLVVANEVVPEGLHLTRSGQAVEIVVRDAVGERPFFEITEASITSDRAHAAFVYPVEGIAGSVSFAWMHGQWAVERCELSERGTSAVAAPSPPIAPAELDCGALGNQTP